MATDLVSRVTTIVAVVDKATAVLRAIETRLGGLGRVAVNVSQKFRGIAERTGLNRIGGMLSNLSARARGMATDFGKMLLPLVGLGAGGAAITGILSLQHGLDAFIETGKRLNVVHERLGITVERLQDFEHWALLAEVPTEAMDQAMGRLNRTLAQVAAGKNKEATKLLGFIHVSARDAHKHVRSAADVMPQLADAMARIHNPAQRARLAVALFGKSGQLLIPMLAQGSRSLKAATQELDRMGRMSAKDADLADKLDDEQQRLGVVLGRVAQIIGAKLAPYIITVVHSIKEWIINNRRMIELRVDDWIKRGTTAIATWWAQMRAVKWDAWLASLGTFVADARWLVELIGGVNVLLGVFVGLLVATPVINFTTALLGLVPVLWDVAAALVVIEGPVWVVIGLLALGAIAVAKYWKQIQAWARTPVSWDGLTKPLKAALAVVRKAFDDTWSTVKELTVTTWTTLVDAVTTAFDRMRASVADTLQDIVDRFSRAWDRIASNPVLRLLSGLIPGLVGAPIVAPAGATAVPPPGIAAVPPPPPPRGASPVGPYRDDYRYPGAGNGTVDVNVSFQNVPQGTRTDTQTHGRAVRANTRVGYSMPQTRRAFG